MINPDHLLETNLVPDALIRAGIRRLLASTLREKSHPGVEAQRAALLQYVADLKKRGIVQTGDVYAITCGEPMGSPGGTNMLKICKVG